MWGPDDYLEQLYKDSKPKLTFQAENEEQWALWREQLKGTFCESLGAFPAEPAALEPTVLETVEYEQYIRTRVEFTTYNNVRMPAYVLTPKNKPGKLASVIALHGHGYGSKEIVGLNPDGSEQTGDPGYQKNFALELVRRGFLVIAPELMGFGDRRLKEDKDADPRHSSCHRLSSYLLMMGQTMAGHRVYETMRTIDYLATRADVDPERIGSMGISGGGLVCSFTAAIDERIKVAVVSGYLNTFKDSVMAVHHCTDNFIPSIIKDAEMPDIFGLIAPRALMIESGTEDNIFPVDAVHEAYGKLEHIYDVVGVKGNLDCEIFEGEHEIWGNKAYTWFDRL